jgi:hypothetical protein
MLVFLMEGINQEAAEMASCGIIHVPSEMKIGAAIQAILRYCLRNVRVCNIGITDGRDLSITPLR